MVAFASAPGQESIFGDNGPHKLPSGSRLDGFHRREVFLGKIQEIARMRVGDLCDFTPVLPK